MCVGATDESIGDPSPKSHAYVSPVPVPGVEPDESNVTTSGASPIVDGPAPATATGGPESAVVGGAVVPPPPPPGVSGHAVATRASSPTIGISARRRFILCLQPVVFTVVKKLPYSTVTFL